MTTTQTQEKAVERILQIIGEKEVTPENVLLAGQAYMREAIYRDYPASDPKVVEALLLMYANVCSDMFKEIDKEEKTEEIGEALLKEMHRFGSALNKTIKTLAGS